MADSVFDEILAAEAQPATPVNPQVAAPDATTDPAIAQAEAAATGGVVPQDPQPPQPGMGVGDVIGAVASDIGTGVTELPRAVVKGARDAIQNTGQTIHDMARSPSRDQANYVALKAHYEKIGFSGPAAEAMLSRFEPKDRIEQLPDLEKPKSVTGQFATAISQFAVGMLGVTKVTAPAKAIVGVGAAAQTIKAASVGAVAFDPSEKRLSNLVESIPGLSNPITGWLAADPKDSRAIGRVKNALESIGMDLAIVGPLSAAMRIARGKKGLADGTINTSTFDSIVADAEKEIAKAAKGGPVRDILDLSTPVTSAGKKRAVTLAQPADGAVSRLLTGMRKDEEALATFGGWDDAIANGHKFGADNLNIPWQKLGTDETALGGMTLRIAEEIKRSTAAARGGEGGVMGDSTIKAMITRRANMWNEDPAELISALQAAGKNAKGMAANMEAGYLVASRAFQDTYAMAQRILAGNLDEFGGSLEAAHKALHDMVGIVGTTYNAATAMRASAGRAMRRMRPEFAIDPKAVADLQNIDPMKLAQLISSTGGNPAAIKKLAQPGFAEKALDGAQWLLTNNLLWAPTTHAVNLTTNMYMMAARPLERIIGGAFIGGSQGAALRREAQYQMAYYSSTLVDGWRSAVKAWKLGDSVLTPHNVEAYNVGGNISQAVAQMQFKSPDSIANVLHNVMAFATKTIGAPTRALGVADEMVKQIVYRSKVAAQAHREAVERGLDAAGIRAYVLRNVDEAFDATGRALREDALNEAKIATFQQDLLPKTFGYGVQNMTTSFPAMRLVLPFIRTPINVMRSGWKMTPGLNLLQTEYRNMLSGRMGAEAQAQAIGQMSMGSLLMGTMALFATSGMVTGGGPTDAVQRKRLMDTGWRPYSFVTIGKDGKKNYIQYGKFDPIAMPFGVVADLVDAFHIGSRDGEDWTEKLEEGSTALLISLTKQMANKSFLLSINQAVDALSDPDRSFGKFAQQMGANFMPMASALRFGNPDPHLRETRTVVDKMLSQVPGLSEKLPPRRDAFGEPVLGHKGITSWSETDLATVELQRMVEENGQSFGAPSPTVDKVDLREVTTAKGENAYDLYQRLAAKPSKSAVPIKDMLNRIIASPAYKKAPDGDADLKGTKLYMLTGIMAKYRDAARKQIMADPKVREALLERHLDVAAAYSAKKAPKTPEKKGTEGLINLGQSFGVDLTPLIPK